MLAPAAGVDLTAEAATEAELSAAADAEAVVEVSEAVVEASEAVVLVIGSAEAADEDEGAAALVVSAADELVDVTASDVVEAASDADDVVVGAADSVDVGASEEDGEAKATEEEAAWDSVDVVVGSAAAMSASTAAIGSDEPSDRAMESTSPPIAPRSAEGSERYESAVSVECFGRGRVEAFRGGRGRARKQAESRTRCLVLPPKSNLELGHFSVSAEDNHRV